MTDDALTGVLREGGVTTWAYLDVSGDVEDPRRMAEHRRRTLREALAKAGAPGADIDAIDGVVADEPGVPSPVARYVLARDGEVLLDEVLPGRPAAPESSGTGAVPDLVPLLRHRPSGFGYLVVEAGRDGGEVRLFHSGSGVPDAGEKVRGDTGNIRKVRVGGWAHARYQRYSEQVWRHNMQELGGVIDRLVLEHRPRLLVLAGDVRAAQLLESELSAESRGVLTTVSTYTRPDGASDDALQEAVAELLAAVARSDRADAVDHLGSRPEAETAHGTGPVVHALQQAQAESVLLDPARLADRTLLALDEAPWVSTVPEEALGAVVLGEVRADTALMRAALLTDADLVLIGTGDLPDGAEIAAVSRWPTGPAVPGA